jgi:hypothetical protein
MGSTSRRDRRALPDAFNGIPAGCTPCRPSVRPRARPSCGPSWPAPRTAVLALCVPGAFSLLAVIHPPFSVVLFLPQEVAGGAGRFRFGGRYYENK